MYHEREDEGGGGGLDDPECGQGARLDGREQVHLLQGDVAQVEVVRLVLHRHQHQEHAVYELHPLQRVDAHVHEDPVQDRHGDVEQDGRQLHRQPRQQEHADPRHPLLPHAWRKIFSHGSNIFSSVPRTQPTLELGRLARCGGLAVHLEAVDVSEAEDGGGDAPGEAEQRADPHHEPHHQHVQVVAAALLKIDYIGDKSPDSQISSPSACAPSC